MEKCGMYLGCNIPFNAPDIEQSFRKVFPALGVDPVDLEGATCCPGWGTAPSFDINTWLAVSSRNIILAEEKGLDILTGCNSCYGIFSEAKHFLDHEPERKKAVNKKLSAIGREYKGVSDVYHAAHMLHNVIGVDKIKEKAKYTLKQLKIAIQPGCHVLWPSRVMKVKEPNPFFPTMLKDICEAMGADVPHYSMLEACCGMGAMRSTDQNKSFSLLKPKMECIKEETDPDIIVTSCSSCYLQLDGAQKLLRESGEIDFTIPVLYVTQLVALVMGFDPGQVAAISQTPRDELIKKIQSQERTIQ